MPKTPTESLLDLLDGISTALDSIIIKDEPSPDKEDPTKDETAEEWETVEIPNPYLEAMRILTDLEEKAVDDGDTDLALAVADRWITLGTLV